MRILFAHTSRSCVCFPSITAKKNTHTARNQALVQQKQEKKSKRHPRSPIAEKHIASAWRLAKARLIACVNQSSQSVRRVENREIIESNVGGIVALSASNVFMYA